MARKKAASKAAKRKKSAARDQPSNTQKRGATTPKTAASKDSAFTRQFRTAIIEKLDDWVETVPEAKKPLIGAADGSTTMSPKDIVEHVKKRTPLGEKVVSNWAELTLKSIKQTPLV